MFLPCFFTMSFDKSFSSAQQTSAVLSNGTFNLDTSFIWSRSVFRKADIEKRKVELVYVFLFITEKSHHDTASLEEVIQLSAAFQDARAPKIQSLGTQDNIVVQL